jgi:hypothetical protein
MKNTKSSRMHHRRKKRRKGDTDQLAAQLAPLEEQDKPAAEQQIGGHVDAATQSDRYFGAIIVDNKDSNVPTDIMETEEKKQFLGIEPVVLVVLIIMLIFIAFITWRISLMPAA